MARNWENGQASAHEKGRRGGAVYLATAIRIAIQGLYRQLARLACPLEKKTCPVEGKTHDARPEATGPMNCTTTGSGRRPFSQSDGAMDQTDWEIVAIEAKHGGVSPETARAVVDEAEELFSSTTVTITDVLPAARAVLELLKRHIPPTRKG